MREIKFRAWYKLSNKMCHEFGNGGKETNGVNRIINDYQEDNSWVIMQFTGLKDKNGKDIYEGDIVEYHNKHIYEIVFNSGRFGMLFHGAAVPPHTPSAVEVIGNIYENPGLLNNQEQE